MDRNVFKLLIENLTGRKKMQNVTYTIGSGIIPAPQPIQLKDIVESISKEKVLVDFNINADKITCYFANKVTGDVTVDIFDLVQVCRSNFVNA